MDRYRVTFDDAEVWEHDGDARVDTSRASPKTSPTTSRNASVTRRLGWLGPRRGDDRFVDVADVAVPRHERGTYLLPVKKPVRKAEGLEAGTVAQIALTVLVD